MPQEKMSTSDIKKDEKKPLSKQEVEQLKADKEKQIKQTKPIQKIS